MADDDHADHEKRESYTIEAVVQRIDAAANKRAPEGNAKPVEKPTPWSLAWLWYWLTIWIPRGAQNVTAAATVVYAIFAILLWSTTRESVNLTRHSIEVSKRPWILFDPAATHVVEPEQVTVLMRNYGESPAFNLGRSWQVEQSIDKLRALNSPGPFNCGSRMDEVPIVPPNTELEIEMPKASYDRIDSTKRWYARLSIGWQDQFGTYGCSVTCLEIDPSAIEGEGRVRNCWAFNAAYYLNKEEKNGKIFYRLEPPPLPGSSQ